MLRSVSTFRGKSTNKQSLQTNQSIKRFYSEPNETTHFGFQTIQKDLKESQVGKVFHNVASSYDVMNDFMSGGIHRWWKDELIKTLGPRPGTNILDVAGGTGDIAFRIADALEKEYQKKTTNNQSSKIVVCDINPSMLAVGKDRAIQQGLLDKTNVQLSFEEGNAENLPFQSNTMDAYTIAFGIRNVTNVDAALREAYRVLKPGGRFLCLEFSRVENDLLRMIYDQYSFNVIPSIGEVVAKDRDSYQYLVESIRRFPDQETFKSMITDAGFRYTRYNNMTFGVVALHSGFKL
eukprot:gb/GECH01000433.1/.p1 GENE.gb/GECH01000433.1/~~gb/GECH01000433.1/.p1  ORF type:complete len:292 (+),score=76.32 gb/GECH01000433.1/:1-876(+)